MCRHKRRPRRLQRQALLRIFRSGCRLNNPACIVILYSTTVVVMHVTEDCSIWPGNNYYIYFLFFIRLSRLLLLLCLRLHVLNSQWRKRLSVIILLLKCCSPASLTYRCVKMLWLFIRGIDCDPHNYCILHRLTWRCSCRWKMLQSKKSPWSSTIWISLRLWTRF